MPRYSGYKRGLSVRINAIFCRALFGVQINSTFYSAIEQEKQKSNFSV